MNQKAGATIAAPVVESAADVAYRHIVLAHYRLATADGIEPELAAACIDELNAAMDALKPFLPPRERKEPDPMQRRQPMGEATEPPGESSGEQPPTGRRASRRR